MQSDSKNFTSFIELLIQEDILSTVEIKNALKCLEGTEGVITDKLFISGYEELARFISKKLSYEKQVSFLSIYKKTLEQNAEARIYFVWAFIDQSERTYMERENLINYAPKDYQEYLKDVLL